MLNNPTPHFRFGQAQYTHGADAETLTFRGVLSGFIQTSTGTNLAAVRATAHTDGPDMVIQWEYRSFFKRKKGPLVRLPGQGSDDADAQRRALEPLAHVVAFNARSAEDFLRVAAEGYRRDGAQIEEVR